MLTVDQEWELHKPNSWTKRESFVVARIVNISFCFEDTSLSLAMTSGPVVCQLWWTYCTPAMMGRLIVHQLWWVDLLYQLWWVDLLYASYDGWTYCTPDMMGGPIVRQLWWVNLFYVSYDGWIYCMSAMMSGPILSQLWWVDLFYVSYDEWIYCMPVMPMKKQRKILEEEFHDFFHTSTDFFCVCAAGLLP